MTVWLGMLVAFGVMSVVMALLWFVQRRTGNAGIVDIAWSLGTGFVAVWLAYVADGDPLRRTVVAVLAGVWGVRLGFHLLRRVLSEEEDGRYQMLREQWGDRTQLKLFWFFQLQASWSVLFALPMLLAACNPAPAIGLLDLIGIAFWLVSMIGESVADAQLAAFRRSPDARGKVCQQGLWRYSRHPNYFFEWLHWWAYVFLAITWSWGWLTLLGPAVMLFFLLRVTGIPMTEERAIRSRGDAYREYQRTTNAFFPGPPKRDRPVLEVEA